MNINIMNINMYEMYQQSRDGLKIGGGMDDQTDSDQFPNSIGICRQYQVLEALEMTFYRK